jgi:hypothetical protein
MSDIIETIQESVEKAEGSSLNTKIAMFVAITATFMALCNVKGGNITQAMSQVQAHSIDAWSFYQAKSTKQNLAENTLEIIKMNGKAGSAELAQKYEEKITRYEKEKGEIKAQAEGYEKEYDALNVYDDQFDLTEALLSIAIAMFGLTALTQKKWLLYFACTVSSIGFVLGITAFMHISLHSDLMAKILG